MSEISRTLTAPVGEDEPVRAPVSKKSFSGSGLTLELNLASGQEIDLSIRINQAGGISQLELSSDSELSEADRNKLQSFLKQLSTSMDDLFNGKASNGDVFKFANQSGIEDVELSVYQDDGNHKQGLEFDKEGRGSGRKVEAQWYEYDRAEGVEENHDFSLTKLAKRDDQTAVYGSMNYQWLLDQVDTAMGAMEDKEQGKELSSFFKSGIQALFSTANSGSALLQELGASAQQAKEFIGRSIKVLASDITQGNQQNQPVSQQKQMNALPDFKMDFSSQRKTLGSSQSGSTQNEYQLNMAISQNSDQAHNAQKDESYQTQNRRLRMDYQSSRQQAVYEYTWTRDESIRNVFESGSLASTHYRIEERIQSQLLGENGNSEALEYKDREDTDII
jgi:hypothetical protein